jgi:hypothetical protein
LFRCFLQEFRRRGCTSQNDRTGTAEGLAGQGVLKQSIELRRHQGQKAWAFLLQNTSKSFGFGKVPGNTAAQETANCDLKATDMSSIQTEEPAVTGFQSIKTVGRFG